MPGIAGLLVLLLIANHITAMDFQNRLSAEGRAGYDIPSAIDLYRDALRTTGISDHRYIQRLLHLNLVPRLEDRTYILRFRIGAALFTDRIAFSIFHNDIAGSIKSKRELRQNIGLLGSRRSFRISRFLCFGASGQSKCKCKGERFRGETTDLVVFDRFHAHISFL